MRLFIYANEAQEKEIRTKPVRPEMPLFFSPELPGAKAIEEHDLFFILDKEYSKLDLSLFHHKPVIINSVSKTLSGENLPKNVARINGWPGFLERSVWEIASKNEEETQAIFKKLGWEIIVVKDEPGMVTARIVSMIINEAFYALKENISTKNEIDLAMKLGTNYPFGPFEWAEKIGVNKVFDLLTVLAKKDIRCTPSFQRDGMV